MDSGSGNTKKIEHMPRRKPWMLKHKPQTLNTQAYILNRLPYALNITTAMLKYALVERLSKLEVFVVICLGFQFWWILAFKV